VHPDQARPPGNRVQRGVDPDGMVPCGPGARPSDTSTGRSFRE
jgi:hypothetical protein